MKRYLVLALVVLILIPLAAGCAQSSQPNIDENNDEVLANEPVMDPLLASQVGFDFSLFRSVVSQGQSGNIVLSPISAKIALALAYNGASGEAKEAMAKVLQLEGLSLDDVDRMYKDLIASLEKADPKVELEIADSVWGNNLDFNDEFLARCKDYFGSDVANADFSNPDALAAINAWVSEKTHGKIEKILEHLDPDVMFVLLNAVYFNGKWEKAFDAADTRDEDFFLMDGSTTKVPMMQQSGDFSYYESDQFQMIRLLYGDGRLGMTILLPKEGQDLGNLIGNLNSGDWLQWANAMREKEGSLSMPRFKVEYSKELTNNLVSMGMGPAFSGSAFENMAATPPMCIGAVVQKTYIDVNEEGTEAAAATAVIGVTSINPDSRFVMNVNRPFLFAISDSASQGILFMGSIVNP